MEEILHQLVDSLSSHYFQGGCLGFLNHPQYSKPHQFLRVPRTSLFFWVVIVAKNFGLTGIKVYFSHIFLLGSITKKHTKMIT